MKGAWYIGCAMKHAFGFFYFWFSNRTGGREASA